MATKIDLESTTGNKPFTRKLFHSVNFSRHQALVFAVLFAAVCSYVIYLALASTQTLINEDFSSSAEAADFVVVSGTWSISGGQYHLTSPGAAKNSSYGNGSISLARTVVSGDFTLTADGSAEPSSGSFDDFSIIFDYIGPGNYYYASFNESTDPYTNGVFRIASSRQTRLAGFSSNITAGTMYHIVVQRYGSSIKVWRDGNLVASVNDSKFTKGKVGFGSRNNPATFDNLVVSDGTADTTAPSIPTGLSSPSQATNSISLSWKASSDDTGVTGYRVYRNGSTSAIGTTSTTSFIDTGLTAGTSYSYTVAAFDAAGNLSGQSQPLSVSTVTTPSPSPTPSPSSSPVAGGSGYDSLILGDKPVAYWGMTNPAGTETDLSGHGHAGTYKGGIPTATTLLNGDKAADFNGSGEYLTVPSSAAFSIPTTHQLTWEGWIRPDTLQFPSATTGYADWMGKCQNYSPTCEWEARMYSATNSQNRCSRISAYVFNPGAGLGSAADWQPQCNLLQAEQWLHVVGEYQTLTTPSACNPAYPGTINIWVNGVKQNASYHYPTGCMSQYSIVPTAGSSPLNIGTMAMEYWFKGAIGKVAVYNYLLSQDQINSHYAAMTGVQPSGSCADTCTIPVPTP